MKKLIASLGRMSGFRRCWMGLFLLVCTSSVFSAAPRIAVWDSVQGTNESRFHIEAELHDQVTEWLEQGGCDVKRVTSQQINEPAVFSAKQFDAIVLSGGTFPRMNTRHCNALPTREAW